MEFDRLGPAEWARVQLVYVCTPGNPTGRVMTLPEWKTLFELSDRYGFVIASDECYSEIYFEEGKAPLGGLQAAARLGRDRYDRLVMFSSLSKRSNVPGLRSGFVAGDAAVLKQFLLYRTYHGTALSPAVQTASVAAWRDEAHVVENRRLYAEKFAQATPVIQRTPEVRTPGCGVLPVGRARRSTTPSTPAPVRRAPCDRAARQLPVARRRRRQSRRRARPHRARRLPRRSGRSGRAHRLLRPS